MKMLRIKKLMTAAIAVSGLGLVQNSSALLTVENVQWWYAGCIETGLPCPGVASITNPQEFHKAFGRRAPVTMDWSKSHLLALMYGQAEGEDTKLVVDRIQMNNISVAGKTIKRILHIDVVPYQWAWLYLPGDDPRVSTTPTKVVKLDIPANSYDLVELSFNYYPATPYLIREPALHWGHCMPCIKRNRVKTAMAPVPPKQEVPSTVKGVEQTKL